MCGFAGVIVWDERLRVSRERLARMSARIAHRGPDGEGVWFNHDDAALTPQRPQARLAFRRLAILDPDPRAMQPFADSTGITRESRHPIPGPSHHAKMSSRPCSHMSNGGIDCFASSLINEVSASMS